MATALKTWTTNELLTSSDLNAEFANVYANLFDLASAQTITGVKTVDDDTNFVFGAGTDYWWVYDSSNTQFELNSTDVDGAGADGIVFKVDDGTDDVTFTGVVTAETLEATGDTAAGDNAAMGYTATEGLILTGQGSTNDVTVKNDADADVLVIPTGTTNVDIVGVATAATFEPDGDTAAGDNAAIGYTATEGLILTGQGSTNDVTIKNDADGTVWSLPTGGTASKFGGVVTIQSGTTTGATATGAADDLVIDTNNGDNGGLTILSKNDALGKIHFGDPEDADVGQIYYDHAANALNFVSGGIVGINETSNANMTVGLTINQGASDNEILAFKSSDVAHGVTTQTETDTYAFFEKNQDTSGGLIVRSFQGNSGVDRSLTFVVCGGDGDNTTSTSTGGNVYFDFYQPNGTGLQAMGASKAMMTLANAGTTRFILNTDGDGLADVTWTTYSDRRLKKNVNPIPYGLDEVMKLDALVFDKHSGAFGEDGEVVLEDNPRRMLGFIAQDARDLMPELVRPVNEGDSFYSMDYGRFTPILWKAVQELATKVAALEAA